MFNRNLEFCYVCGKKFEALQKDSPVSMVETYCPYCGTYMIGEGAATILEHPHDPNFMAGKYELAKLRSALFYYLRVQKQNHLGMVEKRVYPTIYVQTDLVDFKLEELSDPVSLEAVYSKYPQTEEMRLDAVLSLLATFTNESGERHFKHYLAGVTDPNRPYDCLYMPATADGEVEKESTLRKLEDRQEIIVEGDTIALTEKGRIRADALLKNTSIVV